MAISQITGNSIANSTITLDDLNFNPVPSNGSINVGQLDTVYSNGVGGMVVPGGANTLRPESGVVDGTIRYDSSNNYLQLFANSAWQDIRLADVGPFTVQYLIVAGGGGGGNFGGGGGAGGVKQSSFTATPGDSYTVTLGAGGQGHPGVPGNTPGLSTTQGANGSSTTISTPGATTVGGGGGGGNSPTTVAAQSGFSGGSGGGASNQNATGIAGLGTPGQGFDGGSGEGSANNNKAGGGGGSGQPGYSGSAPANTCNGGDGTLTYSEYVLAATLTPNGHIAGGGGGAGSAAPSSLGGAGGGGNIGSNGLGSTGGGGGGNNTPSPSGSGGSGVAILRYSASVARASGGNISQSGGFQYHTFLTSGTFTVL
jgi:hypothetical protein